MAEGNQVAIDLLERITKLSNDIMEPANLESFGEEVAKCYDPVRYARERYKKYLNKFFPAGPKRKAEKEEKKILFLGMNPGWGAAKTGVAFCEQDSDCELLIDTTNVGRPEGMVDWPSIRPKREKYLWNLLLDLFNDNVEELISSQLVFVHYYCPVMLLDSEDKYVALEKLTKAKRLQLESLCDVALHDVVKLLGVTDIVAVGKYAAKAAHRVFPRVAKGSAKTTDKRAAKTAAIGADKGAAKCAPKTAVNGVPGEGSKNANEGAEQDVLKVKIHMINHPDNHELRWEETAEKILDDASLLQYFPKHSKKEKLPSDEEEEITGEFSKMYLSKTDGENQETKYKLGCTADLAIKDEDTE